MSNNYDEYEYEDGSYNNDSNNGINILNKIGIALLIIIAIIIILVLLKGCGNRKKNSNNGDEIIPDSGEITPIVNYETALLEAGKKYFANNMNDMPTAVGDCYNVTLQTLIMDGYLSSENFKLCNSINTYVRACKLENGSIQYTPWFACNDKISSEEYGQLTDGTLNDIVPDVTYVDFLFLPQQLKKTTEQLGKVEEIWKDDIKYVSYKT